MDSNRCLLLACGNSLRQDDGVGQWLANWARERFQAEPGLRIVACPQWTPELADEVGLAESILFVDAAADLPPGEIRLAPIEAADVASGFATHHLGAAKLIALGRELYESDPLNALLLTVGAGSLEIGDEMSDAVKAALPTACALLEKTVLHLLGKGEDLDRRAECAVARGE